MPGRVPKSTGPARPFPIAWGARPLWIRVPVAGKIEVQISAFVLRIVPSEWTTGHGLVSCKDIL